jgi:hypothetical protein
VRQGRTDAWIAHKLDVSIEQLARFKREHALDEDGAAAGPPADPLSVPPPEDRPPERETRTRDRESRSPDRASRTGAREDLEPDEREAEDRPADERGSRSASPRSRGGYRESRSRGGRRDRPDDAAEPLEREDVRRRRARAPRDDEPPDDAERDDDRDSAEDGAPAARRRRGRRGGRRRRRDAAFEATFDHGDEGYGLWLDPAVADDPVYTQHWAGHRAVTVSVSAEEITIRRVGDGAPEGEAD